jgi:branched-chain amino acid transport system substrate-binding protein
VQAASTKFLGDYKAKFNAEPIQYSPFTYDSTQLLIAAMQKANSSDPAKYLPELAKISHDGATGKIEFDEKGDRKNAEITIFMMKSGKIEPLAIIKGGASMKYQDYVKAATPAPAATDKK